jgi:hypothetical protein
MSPLTVSRINASLLSRLGKGAARSALGAGGGSAGCGAAAALAAAGGSVAGGDSACGVPWKRSGWGQK